MTTQSIAALILRIIGLCIIAYSVIVMIGVLISAGFAATGAIAVVIPLMILGVGLIVFSKPLGVIISAGL